MKISVRSKRCSIKLHLLEVIWKLFADTFSDFIVCALVVSEDPFKKCAIHYDEQNNSYCLKPLRV